jgi:hypothetical protein
MHFPFDFSNQCFSMRSFNENAETQLIMVWNLDCKDNLNRYFISLFKSVLFLKLHYFSDLEIFRFLHFEEN